MLQPRTISLKARQLVVHAYFIGNTTTASAERETFWTGAQIVTGTVQTFTPNSQAEAGDTPLKGKVGIPFGK